MAWIVQNAIMQTNTLRANHSATVEEDDDVVARKSAAVNTGGAASPLPTLPSGMNYMVPVPVHTETSDNKRVALVWSQEGVEGARAMKPQFRTPNSLVVMIVQENRNHALAPHRFHGPRRGK